jgi:hypothetical protein
MSKSLRSMALHCINSGKVQCLLQGDFRRFSKKTNFSQKPLDIRNEIPYNSRPQTKRGTEKSHSQKLRVEVLLSV